MLPRARGFFSRTSLYSCYEKEQRHSTTPAWRSETRQANGQQFEVVLVKCEGAAQELPFVLADENTMVFGNGVMYKVR